MNTTCHYLVENALVAQPASDGSRAKKSKSPQLMRYSAMALAVASVISFYSTNAKAATEYNTKLVVGAGQTLTLSPGDRVVPTAIGDKQGAISVSGAGAVLNTNGATIIANGSTAQGILLQNGGALNFVDTDISSVDYAINAVSSVVNLSGGTITTGTSSKAGAITVYFSTLGITGTKVSATGSQATGVFGSHSTITLEDVDIFVNSAGGIGFDANVKTNSTVKNSVIKTEGNDTTGVTMYGDSLSLLNVDITTSGSTANGINVYGGAVDMIDSDISTEGKEAHGIRLYGSSSSSVTANDVRVTVKGENAAALLLDTNSAEQRATLQNSRISSVQSDGIRLYRAIGTVNLTGSSVTGGNGVAMNVTLGSTGTLVADDSTLNGDLVVSADSTADVTLKNSSVFNGAADSVTTLDMDNSRWNLSRDSNVDVFKAVGSTVAFNAPEGGAFKTLTLGSLGGSNTTFVLNTVLDEGGANAQSDKIHITGDASGDHTLVINQAGGLGALTEGDGIQVVAIDGNATGSFKLGNRVSADAYEYLLYQGGESDANDWYLRSYVQLPAEPTDEGESGSEGASGSASGGSGEGAKLVLYRPEVANYVAAPYLNEQYGFDAIGTRHERIGDDVSRSANGAWGRISGQHVENESGSFSYTTNTWFAQLGMDLYQAQNDADTKTIAGVMMTLGRQTTDAKDSVRSLMPDMSTSVGNIDSDMYSLGAYYSRDTQDGAYLDLVTQGTYYRNEYSSDHDAKQTGYGAVLSAEVGKAFPLGNGWSVEPQAQLMYQYLNLDAFHDDVSDVEGVSHSSVRARGGLRITKDMETVKPYVTMDVVHSLNDAPDVKVGSTKMNSGFTETWWRMGTGVSVKVADRVSVYGDVKYQKDFSSDVDGYSGNVGVKVSF
ncbi:autotransporter [Leminorella grimontii]|uniref:Autotransporter n=1 Tax=Leminorella grimontii TaxID=82981 RepID=A0AAV5MYP6_9GAMM|nr:autotransporter outer membrane beta-barrel domain-containing protein [Leminorella grimontii]GKX53894.1 autotransporter [Leminorella grimontii]VFS60644.1 Fluffing protein [Leminorella grimontii]